MKKINLILFFILISTISGMGQNIHREYMGGRSAVTHIHSSGRAYLFSTGSQEIRVLRLNSTTLLPIGNNAVMNNQVTSYNFSVNGVFEDFNGDMIVYGNSNNSNYRGFIVKFSDTLIVRSVELQTDYTDIVSGCCGFGPNDSICYGFVNSSGDIFFLNEFLNPVGSTCEVDQGNITHISWDDLNLNFIFSGYSHNGFRYCTFVGYLDRSLTVQAVHGVEPISFYTIFGAGEYRTLHVFLWQKEIVCFQNLRIEGANERDLLWLFKMDYISGVITSTYFHIFPSTKLPLYDISFNISKKKIYVLGRYIPCGNGRNFIAQVDARSLRNLRAINVFGLISNPCPDDSSQRINDLDLRQMKYNPFNRTVISTGIYGDNVYTNETVDVNGAICDPLIRIRDTIPGYNRINLQFLQLPQIPIMAFNFNPTTPTPVLTTETCK